MRILLVEDSQSLCESITYQLEQEAYQVEVSTDGLEALELIRCQAYDAVILDRMLPGLDGMSILAAIRREKIMTPVLILTALDKVDERVAGLDAGADDYLVKPFVMGELLARVRSLCRRPREWTAPTQIVYGDLTLDPARQALWGPGGSTALSRKEARLLEVFLHNPEQVLPREMLFARVWGTDSAVEYSNLDSYIYFLRSRLREVKSALQIRTRRSVGYQLRS